MFKKLLIAVIIMNLFVLGAVKVDAALTEGDWNTLNDNAVLIDSDTRLEWLDLSQTAGLSYDSVATQLGAGGTFDGFRYASGDELYQLFTNAGIPDINVASGGTPANVSPVRNLLTIWDADLDLSYDLGFMIISNIYSTGMHYKGIIWDRTIEDINTAEATTQRAGNSDADNVSYIGSALVRSSAVPIPSTISLLGFGLLGLAGVSRKK